MLLLRERRSSTSSFGVSEALGLHAACCRMFMHMHTRGSLSMLHAMFMHELLAIVLVFLGFHRGFVALEWFQTLFLASYLVG